MTYPSSFSGTSQPDDPQLQRMRTDIKNVIPLDIYETMNNAALIISDLSVATTPQTRHIREFHASFWKLYQLLQKTVKPDLKQEIDTWFEQMASPNALKKRDIIRKGIDLWKKFYDALTEFGMVTLFEGSIQPTFAFGYDIDLDLEEICSDLHMQTGTIDDDPDANPGLDDHTEAPDEEAEP